ncbi:hypothetical protein, partial [Verrucomicrobium spinosum]|uniref:hypothetical protein n=1 Tax=Verrucomicrobium spinosum TaxID=2736 RepID=UPI001C49567F
RIGRRLRCHRQRAQILRLRQAGCSMISIPSADTFFFTGAGADTSLVAGGGAPSLEQEPAPRPRRRGG